MKKVIVISVIALFIGTMTCITEEGAILKNRSLTSTLGDFEVVSNFSNGIYSYTRIQNFKNN